jgi:hypothetical protein
MPKARGRAFPPDCCVADYDTIVSTLLTILSDLSEEERDRIFYANAEAIYRPVPGRARRRNRRGKRHASRLPGFR